MELREGVLFLFFIFFTLHYVIIRGINRIKPHGGAVVSTVAS